MPRAPRFARKRMRKTALRYRSAPKRKRRTAGARAAKRRRATAVRKARNAWAPYSQPKRVSKGKRLGHMFIKNNAFPSLARAQLDYVDEVTFSSAGFNASGYISIRLNGLVYPMITSTTVVGDEHGAGLLAAGGYNMCRAFYNRYRVYATKVTFHIVNEREHNTSGSVQAGARVWGYLRPLTGLGGDASYPTQNQRMWADAGIQRKHKFNLDGASGVGARDRKSITYWWTEKGLRSSARDENEAAFGANPGGEATDQALQLHMGTVDGTQTWGNVRVMVRVRYYVQLSECRDDFTGLAHVAYDDESKAYVHFDNDNDPDAP